MEATLRAGQYGWDYILDFGDSWEALIQSDHDYVPLANLFGYQGSDIRAAREFLDDRIGETVDVDVEDTDSAAHSWYIYAVSSLGEEEGEPPAQAPTITKDDVTWQLYCLPEDAAIDAEDWADEETLRRIRRELQLGNQWAWCTAVVEGRYGSLTANAHLGACSYRNAEDFKQSSGYYEDMRNEVLEDLNRQLAGARTSLMTTTSPLIIRFMEDEMEVKLDGSLDDEEKRRLEAMPEESALSELFENAVANGIIDRIDPEEISAVTAAPTFADPSDVERDPATGELIRCEGVYWWPNYQIESLVATILAGGRVILPKVGVGFTQREMRARYEWEGRTGQVVKADGMPIEGEWEKDEI